MNIPAFQFLTAFFWDNFSFFWVSVSVIIVLCFDNPINYGLSIAAESRLHPHLLMWERKAPLNSSAVLTLLVLCLGRPLCLLNQKSRLSLNVAMSLSSMCSPSFVLYMLCFCLCKPWSNLFKIHCPLFCSASAYSHKSSEFGEIKTILSNLEVYWNCFHPYFIFSLSCKWYIQDHRHEVQLMRRSGNIRFWRSSMGPKVFPSAVQLPRLWNLRFCPPLSHSLCYSVLSPPFFPFQTFLISPLHEKHLKNVLCGTWQRGRLQKPVWIFSAVYSSE